MPHELPILDVSTRSCQYLAKDFVVSLPPHVGSQELRAVGIAILKELL
jgi:hypothetical protein